MTISDHKRLIASLIFTGFFAAIPIATGVADSFKTDANGNKILPTEYCTERRYSIKINKDGTTSDNSSPELCGHIVVDKVTGVKSFLEYKTVSPYEIGPRKIEGKIFDSTNSMRKSAGAQPLMLNGRLSEVALAHSADMVERNYFKHENPEGIDPTARGAADGITCEKDDGFWVSSGIGENIAQDSVWDSSIEINGETYYKWLPEYEIGNNIMQGWWHSPGHKANILEMDYASIGIGVSVASDGRVLATQDFCVG